MAVNNIRRTVIAPAGDMSVKDMLMSLLSGGPDGRMAGGGGGRGPIGGGGSGSGGGGGGGNPLGKGPGFGGNMSQNLAKFSKANPALFPALTVIGAGVPAALEFTDDDPLAKNALQAGGRFAGALAGQGAGTVLGGIIGTALLPGLGTAGGAAVGRILGGLGGSYLGSTAGAGILGGIYDALAGSDEDRARREKEKNANLETKILLDRLQAIGPVQQKLAEMADARAVNVARQNMQINRDYNFGNMLDQSTLLAQQNHAQLNAIAMQQLL